MLKNKIRKIFCSTIRKNLFTTRARANNNNNIKSEYIEHIKALGFKMHGEQFCTPRRTQKNINMQKLKMDINKLYDYNYINNCNSKNNEKKEYERNDLDLFLLILDIHLKIENIFLKMKKNNLIIFFYIKNKNKLIMINAIIDLIIKFFNIVKLVYVDIDFLVEINKNRLVRKTI